MSVIPRPRIFCLLALFLLAAGGTGLAQADFEKVEIQTVKVSDNISMLVGLGGNISVFGGPDGVLLIDDEFAQVLDKIKAAVARVSPGPIRIVFNTNWHYDHANGNEQLAKEGAIVIAHENSRTHMMGEQRFAEADPDFKIPPYPEAALPKITVRNGLTLHFNGEEVMAMHVPNAHSDGDLLFYFRKANVIHAGDLIFSNGFPFINVSSGGTIGGMIAAADTILEMSDVNTRIICGHGPLTNRTEVQAYREMLAAARDRIAKLIKEGKSLEESIKANPVADLYKKGNSNLPAELFVKVVYMDLARK